ncbi:hypothetical protein F5Y07DRAFT_119715 [Xylaria sp. FL0933]|nr:hypothetical protein F5Y07DRAFT_119715 [Xylaria sp. FL0933]
MLQPSRIIDGLGDLEDADGKVRFWPILTGILRSLVETSTQLAELLHNITVTLRGSSGQQETTRS